MLNARQEKRPPVFGGLYVRGSCLMVNNCSPPGRPVTGGPDKLNAELGALSLLPTGFFYAGEVKRPTIHIKVAVTVELIESIKASEMVAWRPVTNDW